MRTSRHTSTDRWGRFAHSGRRLALTATVITALDLMTGLTLAQTGTTTNEVAKFLAADGAADDVLSFSITISGNTFVTGAPNDSDIVMTSGSAYVFDLAPGSPADFNGDGVVNAADLAVMLGSWGPVI